MSRGRGHVFDDLSKLNEMLALRGQGVSTVQLGNHYGVDHTTIVYHSKRYGVTVSRKTQRVDIISASVVGPPRVVVRPKFTIRNNVPVIQMDFDGTVVNRGKTYAEYVREAAKIEQMRKYGRLLIPEPKNND